MNAPASPPPPAEPELAIAPVPHPACAACGYATVAGACAHCHGTMRALDGRGNAPLPARDGPLALLRGARDVRRALFALLHGKEYVGLLRLPVAANALAFLAVLLG